MTTSDRAAEEGFAIAPDLLAYAIGGDMTEAAPPATIGNATRFFRTDDALVAGKTGKPGAVLFWRSGMELAAIYVAGLPPASLDRLALSLARDQQRHIDHPSSYTRSEQDWTLVPLENPGIRLPV